MGSTITLKKQLRAGALSLGGWASLGSPAVAEILCRAGCDWVAIDLEHSTTSLETAEAIIRAVDGCGKAPLVRLSAHDPVQIKRVMDAGAHGIIAPNVTRLDQLEAVYAAMHYPPVGRRGVGLGRAQGYGPGFDDYRRWLATSSVLIAQIEHADALPHLDEILGFHALDAYFVGPYDLSASLGRPGELDAPEVAQATAQIAAAAARHGVTAGSHVVEPDPAALQRRIDAGDRFIAYSVDFRFIDAACRQGLAAARGGGTQE